MRPSVFAGVLLGIFLVALYSPQTDAQGLGDLLSGDSLVEAITGQLVGLWETGEIEFLDHYCNFQVKPKIKKWQLYFIGTMWCPGWTPIRGTSETRSRSGVVNKAVRDFVQKALNSELITEGDARNWLSHQ